MPYSGVKKGGENCPHPLSTNDGAEFKRRYEPEVYGPRGKSAGMVDSPTHEVFMTADILSLAKLRLGPAYLEERIFGEEGLGVRHWKEVWAVARYDSENYHNWRRIYWWRIDQDCSPATIRKAVYRDFEQAEFRQRLMAAAREYERRVFGPKTTEAVGNDEAVGHTNLPTVVMADSKTDKF